MGTFCQSSSETKVTDPNLAEFVHEDIPWLDVSVDYVSGGKEVEGAKQVIYNVPNMCFIELALCSRFYDLTKVGFNVVHHDKKGVDVIRTGTFRGDYIEQLREEAHAFWAHLGEGFHDLNFSQNFDHFVLIFSEALNHLYRDLLARGVALGFHDTPIRALALLFYEGVVIDNFLPNGVKTEFLDDALLLC